jgi:hypothetical protein
MADSVQVPQMKEREDLAGQGSTTNPKLSDGQKGVQHGRDSVSHPCFRRPGKIGTLNQAWSFIWKALQDAPGTVRFKGDTRLFRRIGCSKIRNC